ncbi:MAG: UDP-N-acetylglucosamine 2-epimerase (non-hydrolyzing) [Bacteroidales bacterium]|nr:UDP-N-acetylglucosamine 2-epimerase (non-hydrolyzing) [Bacteroidales bacterium]
MKILTVVGARPQFVKAAALSREIRKDFDEVLLHTGQHFDDNMSGIFFRELEIPEPDYNLGISGGSHASMTARMMTGIEEVLLKEKPDAVVVFGDTNSTLAAALTAVKLGFPLVHVEAGNRFGSPNMAEEVNSSLTDRCASLLCCATPAEVENLRKEGLAHKAVVVGNIMYDSFLWAESKNRNGDSLIDFNNNRVEIPPKYYYMTCHRQENSNERSLREIMCAMNSLDVPTIFPVHPRNTELALKIARSEKLDKLILVRPVGYLESVHLTKGATKVLTDSGGLQCEAFYAGTQCVTVFAKPMWPETLKDGRNAMAKADRNDILEKLGRSQSIDSSYRPFGNGNAAQKISALIRNLKKD